MTEVETHTLLYYPTNIPLTPAVPPFQRDFTLFFVEYDSILWPTRKNENGADAQKHRRDAFDNEQQPPVR